MANWIADLGRLNMAAANLSNYPGTQSHGIQLAQFADYFERELQLHRQYYGNPPQQVPPVPQPQQAPYAVAQPLIVGSTLPTGSSAPHQVSGPMHYGPTPRQTTPIYQQEPRYQYPAIGGQRPCAAPPRGPRAEQQLPPLSELEYDLTHLGDSPASSHG